MNEMPSISGINEALMGTDISNSQSGRAIELKQKQAITHIAGLFDNLRMAKELIVDMLWGRRGAPGIIPQFYTEQKTFRIVGEKGEPQIVTVNQQVLQQQVNPQTGMIQTITKTLNDLSVGEFDIVIADTPATSTQRTAQFWSLVDACGKLGIQGNMIMDILIDLSDIPQKAEIKRRLKSQQEEQAQAQQQQMQAQMELEKQKRLSRSIAYKDLQLPLQLQLAAQAGICRSSTPTRSCNGASSKWLRVWAWAVCNSLTCHSKALCRNNYRRCNKYRNSLHRRRSHH